MIWFTALECYLFSDRGEFIMIQLAKGVDQLHRTDVMFLGVSDSDNYYENVREYLQDDEKFKVNFIRKSIDCLLLSVNNNHSIENCYACNEL